MMRLEIPDPAEQGLFLSTERLNPDADTDPDDEGFVNALLQAMIQPVDEADPTHDGLLPYVIRAPNPELYKNWY